MLLARNPNAFAHSPLDRAGHRRRDEDWLAASLASDAARLAVFHNHRPFLSEAGPALAPVWLAGHVRAALPPEAPMLFLGVDPSGAPHFAIEAEAPQGPLAELGAFHDLRAAAGRLTMDDLAILGCAKSVFEWHARSGFCAKCGAPTKIVEAGWKRECANCGAEHFPRVDPVAIMLPTFGETCLLARQTTWPRGLMSALAGYMEPGETIEETIARETLEESGLEVAAVRLHSSQPWPFPGSLMLGAICEVTHNRERIDPHELESARWFTRDEARELVAGAHRECFSPPPLAIAHQLLKSWADQA